MMEVGACRGWAGGAACHGEEVLFVEAAVSLAVATRSPGDEETPSPPSAPYAHVPAEDYEAEVYGALVRRAFPTALAFERPKATPGNVDPSASAEGRSATKNATRVGRMVRRFKVPRTVYELFCIREYLRERAHTPFSHPDSPEGCRCLLAHHVPSVLGAC
jgi:hypothetical protein